MQKSPYLLIIFFSCLVALPQQSQAGGEAALPQSKLEVEDEARITAAEYCAFLNAVAANDPQNLYDEKMEGDLAGAGVTRAGAAGRYIYEALELQSYYNNSLTCSLES